MAEKNVNVGNQVDFENFFNCEEDCDYYVTNLMTKTTEKTEKAPKKTAFLSKKQVNFC